MAYTSGKEIRYHCEKLTRENVGLVRTFSCGNEEIDKYLRQDAIDDDKSVIYLYIEEDSSSILGFASISCSGIPCKFEKSFIVHPSILINYFAVSTQIQHLPFDDKPSRDRYCMSDHLFCDLLKLCRSISEDHAGAINVFLYSVPTARGFYARNLMQEYEKFMTRENHTQIEGCIPMFMPI